MKKLTSLILTICMLSALFAPLSVLPASAATSGTTGDCTWTRDGTKLTISGKGEMADYDYDYNNNQSSAPWGTDITSVVMEDGVTSIGRYAFYNCTGLTSITIPNSVTSIGGGAFRYCTGLTSVTIGNGVTSIEGSAFSRCTGLTSVTIPNSVTSIDSYAFYGCTGLSSVTIGNSVTSIGSYAFEGCTGLTSVTIGNSVTSIGESAFSGCTGLTSVTIPDSVTSIGGSAFKGCALLSEINVSSSNSSYASANGVLFSKDLKTLVCYPGGKKGASYTIPDSVTSIGERAFYYCTGLTSVTIGNSVTSIGNYAFCGCTGLTSVTIPDSVTSIGDDAFNSCTGLTSVTIGNSVTSIGGSAFYKCAGLTSVTIGNSVTSIGGSAFCGCKKLTSVTIGNSVKSIGDSAFLSCTGLTSVTIGNSVTTIGEDAFSGCTGLTSVTIPNSVTSIGYAAFSGCKKLTSVTIGNSVTSIGGSAFYYCIGLTSVTIGNSVTSIGGSAFSGCDNLTIYGYSGSYAETYAGKNNIPFVAIDLPQITVQPKSVTVEKNKTAKVTVKAEGEGLTYKWYYKDKGSSAFKLTTSFKGASYSVQMTAARSGRQVYCVITNSDGKSIQTDAVTLSMKTRIVTQPKSVQVAKGKTAKVTVKAEGEGLTYKWYYKDKGMSKFKLTTTFKGATYSVAMSAARSGRQVYCVVTDEFGNKVTSKIVTLSQTVRIATQPKSVTVAKNKTAKVTVKAEGEGLKYTWYVKKAGATKFSKSTVKTSSYSVKMTSSAANRQVYCKVTDKFGNTVTSKTVSMKMK